MSNTQHADTQRILSLPVTERMSAETLVEFTRSLASPEAFANGFRFNAEQGEAIRAFLETGGGFFPISVGGGKSLTCFTIAQKAYPAARKILLLIPPHLVHQTLTDALKFARMSIGFSVPVYSLHGKTAEARRLIAAQGRPGLYIYPYSLLSTPDATDLLNLLGADLVLCDEAHLLANNSAARTRRFFSFISKKQPRGVCLSGTITSKKIMDYQQLANWSLGYNSPLPLSSNLAKNWGEAVDANSEMHPSQAHASLVSVAEAFGGDSDSQAGLRRGFRNRLVSAPGVVASGESSLGVSLTLDNMPVDRPETHPDFAKLQELIDGVQKTWLSPNGDEIDHAIHTWKWLYELSAGFYNQLLWPEPAAYSARKGFSLAEATDRLAAAKEHHELLQEYHRQLRKYLQNSRNPEADTPFKVGSYFHLKKGKGNLPGHLYEAWHASKEAEFEDMPERESNPVRVCDYKITKAAEWLLSLPKGEGALIWAHNIELLTWAHELLATIGIDAVLLPDARQVQEPGRVLLLGIARHSTGLNLQHYRHNFVIQWPRQAKTAEQMLGRTHRQGQQADELVVATCNTLDIDHMNFAACMNDALYIHQTLGAQQKLVYCNYATEPVIFPPEVLRERGLLGL